MATYVSLRATAQRLIQKNGRTITYRQAGTTLVDVNNPQLGFMTPTDTTPKAAFINEAINTRTRDLVQLGDKICLIAADDLPSITPNTADIIIDKGKEWRIQDFESIDPSDAPVVYQFILRS